MPDYDCHTYSVVPGEPHLGKVRECIVTYTHEEVTDAVVEAFLCGELESTDAPVELDDDVYVKIGEYLSYNDIETINNMIEEMPASYWDGNIAADKVYDKLIKCYSEDWEYEIERITYV
jgi:hypothetical protein